MLNLNEVIKGIAVKLNSAFGDRYRIYQNDVEQGLKEPCFLILALKPELKPMIGARYLSNNPLDIMFFPKHRGNNAGMLSVAADLTESLEFIELPDQDRTMLRGTRMSYEIVDGVLHFFVSYNFPLIRTEPEASMESMDATVGIEKG